MLGPKTNDRSISSIGFKLCIFCTVGLSGLPIGMTDQSGSAPSENPQTATLPSLPEDGKKRTASVLFSVADVVDEPNDATIHLIVPEGEFLVEKIKGKTAVWRVIELVQDKNRTIAQVAIRKGNLLFAWSRNTESSNIRDRLQRAQIKVVGNSGSEVSGNLGRIPVAGKHHGYDKNHSTPHEIAHGYNVPDLPERPKIKLKIESPNSAKLTEKTEKQRTVTKRKWLKLPFEFEEDSLKRVKVGMHWMVERPRKNKKKSDQNDDYDVIVNQKLTYDIGAYKDLPLNKEQINHHLKMLKEKNLKDNGKYKIHQRELGQLQQNAASVSGAAPGTKAWAMQTQYHNQIKSKQRVMRSAVKRVSNRIKDMQQLSVFKDGRLDSTLLQLNNMTFPYQVTMETDQGDEVLVESKTWGFSAEQCNLMLGKWVNDKKNWMMDVSEY